MFRSQWKEKTKLPLVFFLLPPQATYLSLCLFPLISWFYFTIVLVFYLCIPSFFPLPINYNRTFWCHRSPTHSLSTWFSKSFFFFAWIYGVVCGHILRASRCASEWKAGPKVIFRFDVDATSLWWKPQTTKGAHLFWSRSPSSLVLPHFFGLSHPSDFCCKLTLLMVMNLKLLKVVTILKTPPSSHGLQFPMLDTTIGCTF